MIICVDLKMGRCEDDMWRCEDEKIMCRCEDEKMYNRPPLVRRTFHSQKLSREKHVFQLTFLGSQQKERKSPQKRSNKKNIVQIVFFPVRKIKDLIAFWKVSMVVAYSQSNDLWLAIL